MNDNEHVDIVFNILRNEGFQCASVNRNIEVSLSKFERKNYCIANGISLIGFNDIDLFHSHWTSAKSFLHSKKSIFNQLKATSFYSKEIDNARSLVSKKNHL